MIMDILGSTLWDANFNSFGQMFGLEMIECIATNLNLKEINSKGYIHGDIKLENIMLCQPSTPNRKKLFSINFGLATRWRGSRSGRQVEYD
eukprot:Gb_21216 [translate_table: standard]